MINHKRKGTFLELLTYHVELYQITVFNVSLVLVVGGLYGDAVDIEIALKAQYQVQLELHCRSSKV
jgi:hypothetical protein